MAIEIPAFDFDKYDAKDVWNFPSQRLTYMAATAYQMANEARRRTVPKYRLPDQRFVVFHELCGISHALLVSAQHLRSHGNDPAWWELQEEYTNKVDARIMASNNSNVRNFLHLGIAEGLLRQMELSFRAYAKALELSPTDQKKQPLNRIWKAVLEVCQLEEYAKLRDLLQIHRDSISQNFRFEPQDEQSIAITYQKRRFAFEAKSSIDFQALGFVDEWEMMYFLWKECIDLQLSLQNAAQLTSIPMIFTSYMAS